MTERSTKDCYRVMGIDPGSQLMGASVLEIDRQTDKAKFVAKELVIARGKSFGERLNSVYYQTERLAGIWRPEVIAWEGPYVGNRNWTAMSQLSKAIGVVECVAVRFATLAFQSAPSTSRKVLGFGSSSYPMLRRLLEEEYGLDCSEKAIKEDVISAMVQAHCAYIVVAGGKPQRGLKLVYKRDKPKERAGKLTL